jgi:hypothetical protein
MPQKDNNVCEIHSFFLAWTRCTCLQESLMAQFEAQDILISVIAYIKNFRDVTVVLELTSVCFVQAYLAKKKSTGTSSNTFKFYILMYSFLLF